MRGEPSRAKLVCLIGAVLVALLATGCGGEDDKDATQSFVGETAGVVLYVTWTRDGDDVTGSLTQGVLDSKKGIVATKRGSLSGKLTGSGVALDVIQQYGETTRLTGRLHGDELALEYLSGSSGVATVQMREGGAEVFNAALAQLRDTAEQSKADAKIEAAESVEGQRVSEHALIVADDIAALKLAADSALPSKATTFESDLARLQRDLDGVRSYAKEALAADALSVCSSAAQVQSATSSLRSGVTALEDKQERAATSTATVNGAISKLIDDFETLQTDETKYLPDDAPTGKDVNRAIAAARKKLRKAGSSKSGALDKARAMLKEAQGLQTKTDIACRTGA